MGHTKHDRWEFYQVLICVLRQWDQESPLSLVWIGCIICFSLLLPSYSLHCYSVVFPCRPVQPFEDGLAQIDSVVFRPIVMTCLSSRLLMVV